MYRITGHYHVRTLVTDGLAALDLLGRLPDTESWARQLG
jgi:hypothetical protein